MSCRLDGGAYGRQDGGFDDGALGDREGLPSLVLFGLKGVVFGD